MEQLTKRLSRYMVRISTVEGENEEVVAYGLFLLFAGAEQILLLAVMGLLLKIPLHMALFVLFYAILKRTIGGWHTSRHSTCLAGYTAIAVIGTLAGRYTPAPYSIPAAAILATITLVLIWRFAPVEHPNNPHKPYRIKKFRKLARILAVCEWVVILVMTIAGGSGAGNFALCAALGGCVAAVTLLIPVRPPNIEERSDSE